MTKKIVKILSIISLILFLVLLYLSIYGVKTSNFNDFIKNKILENNKGINLDLKNVKITLSPLDFKINIVAFDTKLTFNNRVIELESLKTKISILQLFKSEFLIDNLQISSKSIEVKNLISFVRLFKSDPKLFFLEMAIKDGYLEGNLNLNFDKKGKIKNDYKVTGFVKNLEIKILNYYNLEKMNFIFDIKNKEYKFSKLNTQFNKISFNSPFIKIKEKNNLFLVNGKILNNEKNILIDTIQDLLSNYFVDLDLKELNFISDNDFSFDVTKDFKFSDLKISSEINLSKLTYKNSLPSIQKYFPEIKELVNLKNHKIKFNYSQNIAKISGVGKISIEDNEDSISYEIVKKDKQYFFKNLFEIKQNKILIDEFKYRKNKNKKAIIRVDGVLNENRKILFNEISLIENYNSILIKDLYLDNELKISDISLLELDYINYNKNYNQIYLKKVKKNYIVEGKSFDASELINAALDGGEDNTSIFSNLNSKISLKIKKTYIDDINFINNLSGIINYKNNKIYNLNLKSIFPNKKKIRLSIKTNKNNEKITTFFSGHPKPIVKRYKFIKGFDGGYLDFYSKKKDGISNSLLVIDNFKIKEVPVFAKLLSLASLQGIADLLTGEGIRFTDFEMKFNNRKRLITIEEMYAIGPAVSILMDGYIETNKLVSLRGTLVPATTINRSIASIPLIGKILIGDKTGEGVFGVSFKIKGQPENLKTTVNPIKSLTPRFITRTLEKITKN